MMLNFGYGIRRLRGSIPSLVIIDVLLSDMGIGLTLLNFFVYLNWHTPEK